MIILSIVKKIRHYSTKKQLKAVDDLAKKLDDAPKAEYLPGKSPQDILNIKPDPKNGIFRPDPSKYLDPDYVQAHLKQFDSGGTAITKDDYWIQEMGQFGRDDGAFVFPKDFADDMIKASDGDPRKLEEFLGLENGSLGDSPIRVDISSENMANPRVPSGNEVGAKNNPDWRPGAKTHPGGIPEIVVNPPKKGDISITILK